MRGLLEVQKRQSTVEKKLQCVERGINILELLPLAAISLSFAFYGRLLLL